MTTVGIGYPKNKATQQQNTNVEYVYWPIRTGVGLYYINHCLHYLMET